MVRALTVALTHRRASARESLFRSALSKEAETSHPGGYEGPSRNDEWRNYLLWV